MARSLTRSHKNNLAILIFFCFLNFFANNGILLPDIMEARNLVTAREIVEKGNWLSPTMNNYPRFAKPPLPTWINAAISMHYDVSNLSVQRIPNAFIGLLLVIFIYFICFELFANLEISLISALVASTSFYIVFMARQATWDIYAHSTMTGAILFLIRGIKSEGKLRDFIVSGILMGLSFLCKGPIAHYALLLPFLLSWIFFMDRKVFLDKWKGIALLTAFAVVISLSWPMYTLITNYDTLLHTTGTEVNAWANRHVRPFYHYWSFPFQSGFWGIFALISLIYPYMKKRVPVRNYKFIVFWVLFSVILLSIPAEKKERYLMPTLIPLSILTGQYLYYLYKEWQKNKLRSFEKIVVYFHIILLLGVSAAFPYYLYIKEISDTNILLYGVFALFAGFLIYHLFRANLKLLFLGAVLFVSSISLTFIPLAPKMIYKNKFFKAVQSVKDKDYYEQNFYSKFMRPEAIWAIGKPVDTLHFKNDKIILPEKDFILLHESALSVKDFYETGPVIIPLDTLYPDPETVKKRYFVYRIKS